MNLSSLVNSNETQNFASQHLDLAWLAGFMDGEGSVSVEHRYISVSNTDLKAVAKVICLLCNLGINPNLHKVKKMKEHHKQAITINVRRQADILILINAIADMCIIKGPPMRALAKALSNDR